MSNPSGRLLSALDAQPTHRSSSTHASQQNIALIIEREQGLRRSLTAPKLAMISLGSSIGTGLFLGTGFAISLAGPAAIVGYAVSALLALLLVSCLSEMALAHPTSGSFGAYAEHYLGPLAGFLVLYSYWIANVLAMGAEVAAIALYAQHWFPQSPGWSWSAGFGALLVLANLANVEVFGTVEYWLSSAKVIAVTLFVLIASGFLLAAASPFAPAGAPSIGFGHYVDHGGFVPKGAAGVAAATLVAMFSFIGIEIVAVASGEAADPQKTVRGAFRSSVARLILFYLLTVALILAIVPWTQITATTSPFVLVMQKLNIPRGTDIINFVMLLAALSAVNSQLYAATRMLFSLARGGYAPRHFGSVRKRGVPANALLLSTLGMALATALSVVTPNSVYTLMVAISLFGALFTWLMIFVTHYFFRRKRTLRGGTFGAAAMLAILMGTVFSPPFHLTLILGLPFLAAMTVIFWVRRALKPPGMSRATPS